MTKFIVTIITIFKFQIKLLKTNQEYFSVGSNQIQFN